MKILFLSDDFPPESFGGAGISTFELARGMQENGHDVSVVTSCRDKSDAGESEYRGLKIYKIESNYPSRYRAYRSLNNKAVILKLESLLKKIQPDIVHVNNIHFHLSYKSIKVAKKYSKAVFFTARDTMSVCYGKLETKRYLENLDYRTTWVDHLRQAKKRWNPLRNFYIKKYLSYSDRIFAVSHSLRKALEANGISGVTTMHTGGEADAWIVTEIEKQAFQEKYNLTNKKVILFGGRLSESKGGRSTLEAMVEIVKEIPEAVLLVAGTEDKYAAIMKKRAEKLGIESNLIFTGWIQREDIKFAYAVSDVVLVPSTYLDPFPRITIEAMSAGKPVVGTCFGGTPEIVLNEHTGYIVNPLKSDEISDKTLDLLNNEEKSIQFGLSGLNRIESDFNIESKINEHIRSYTAIFEAQKRNLAK